MTRIGAALGLVALLGLATWGCSSKSSGKSVGPAQTANLTVENKGSKTLHVFVDGAEVGDVQPNTTGRFYVNAGFRSLGYRERGDSGIEHQGNYDFPGGSTNAIELTYNPNDPFTLEITNNTVNTLHVFVNSNEIGSGIPPGTTGKVEAPPGRHDLHLRERGEVNADFIGTFNFTKGELVSVTYPIP